MCIIYKSVDDFVNNALFVISFYAMISLIYKCMHDLYCAPIYGFQTKF